MSNGLHGKLPWHDAQWRQVAAWQSQQRLPHALLLLGPEGVGKYSFANRLAQTLLCESHTDTPCENCRQCELFIAGTHPNFHRIAPEETGKAIKIELVRELIQKSVLTTQGEGRRVFLIHPADAMNDAAANALLKTLEEPTGKSHLILVSSYPRKLPATIRSRCQQLTFAPVNEALGRPWLASQLPDSDIDGLMAMSAGAPLKALFLDEQGGLITAGKVVEDLLALKRRQLNPMQLVSSWAERPLETLLAEIGLALADMLQLKFAQHSPRLFLPANTSQLHSLASDLDLNALFGFVDRINRLREKMHHNLNAQMLLEALVNDWLLLTRKAAR